MGRRPLTSSGAGGTRETHEMLAFCSDHRIVADVKVIEPGVIDNAFASLAKADVRYRFVIDIRGD